MYSDIKYSPNKKLRPLNFAPEIFHQQNSLAITICEFNYDTFYAIYSITNYFYFNVLVL